jgi:hypothetical protein
MTDSITPPPELVVEWADTIYQQTECDDQRDLYVATRAAQWGADQQLAEDAKWLDHNALNEPHLRITPVGELLKEAMRPKPPSLKEQALEALQNMDHMDQFPNEHDYSIIRRALEQLDD